MVTTRLGVFIVGYFIGDCVSQLIVVIVVIAIILQLSQCRVEISLLGSLFGAKWISSTDQCC